MKTKASKGALIVVALVGALMMAGSANAQGLQGKFHLDHPVRWAEKVLAPGDYTIDVQSTSQPTLVVISDAAGKRVMFLASSYEDLQLPNASLALLQTDEEWEVRGLNMPEAGRTLRFLGSSRKKEKPAGAVAVTVIKDGK